MSSPQNCSTVLRLLESILSPPSPGLLSGSTESKYYVCMVHFSTWTISGTVWPVQSQRRVLTKVPQRGSEYREF